MEGEDQLELIEVKLTQSDFPNISDTTDAQDQRGWQRLKYGAPIS